MEGIRQSRKIAAQERTEARTGAFIYAKVYLLDFRLRAAEELLWPSPLLKLSFRLERSEVEESAVSPNLHLPGPAPLTLTKN